MATVAQDVAAIREATYGKDVRDAIADGISNCYTDVTYTKNLAEDSVATQQAVLDQNNVRLEAAATAAIRTVNDAVTAATADMTAATSAANTAASNANSAATAANTAATNANNIILVQESQPAESSGNKIWVKPESDEYQVPTWEEFEDLKSAITETTRNIWTYGDKQFTTSSGIFDVDIPSGTYTLSAEVIRNATGDLNANSRIIFYKEGETSSQNVIANPYLKVNTGRQYKTFTINEPAKKAIVLAVVDNAGSANIDAYWKNIQLESGSKATEFIPPLSATDYVAREERNRTRNLWVYGDQSFTKVQTIAVDISAGTYVFSANVISRKNGSEGLGYRARIEFLNGSTNVLTTSICRNCRGSEVITLSSAVNSIKIYASNTAVNSNDTTSDWTDIQLEQGTYLTPYIPPYWKGTIPQLEKQDELFRMEDITIAGEDTQSYFFIRNYQDERNLIIDVDAKYTGERETKYVMPQIRMCYSTSNYGACPYCVGEYDEYMHKQYRMPPFPNYQSGDYVNKMYLQILVPSGLTLNIKKLTVRYSNEMNRPIESGIKIDTHGAFLYYPAHTFPAVNAAQRCGATRCIIIPKRSSDGVWFAYHDDTFDLATTILRNTDGSVIESSEYNGLPFSQIPWETYLKNLTVSIANSYGAFSGVKLMTIEQYFTLCNKTGMKPMFSTHPRYTETGAVQSLYDLAKRMGVLNKLTLKPSSVDAFGDLFPVFGNEIESYGLILKRANHTDADVQTMIDTFDNSAVDKTKVRCYIEGWIDLATTTQIQMILDAGYFASLASYTHTDPSGVCVDAISESDFAYWIDKGVTEFTSSNNTSLGLNW